MEFMQSGFMRFDWTALANAISIIPLHTARATNLAAGVSALLQVEAVVKDANGTPVRKTPVPGPLESSAPQKEVEGRSAASDGEKRVEVAKKVAPATAMGVDAAPVAERAPRLLERMVATPTRRVSAAPPAPSPIATKANQSIPTHPTNPIPLLPKSAAPRKDVGLCIGILPNEEYAGTVEERRPLIMAREICSRQEELDQEREIEIRATRRRRKAAEAVAVVTGDDENADEDYSGSGAEDYQPRKKKVKIDEPVKDLVYQDPKCDRCLKLGQPCFARQNMACENCSAKKQGCNLPHRVKKTSATPPTKVQMKAAKLAREVEAASRGRKGKGRLARVMGRMPKTARKEDGLDENAEAVEEDGQDVVGEAEAEGSADPVRRLRSGAIAESPAPSSRALSPASNTQSGKRKGQRKERKSVEPAQSDEPSGNRLYFLSPVDSHTRICISTS